MTPATAALTLKSKRPSFKLRKSLEERVDEVRTIRSNFPMKIPVIVEKYRKEVHLPALEKEKYLVPPEVTMSQFILILRKKMKLSDTQSFFLIVNNKSMATMSKTIAEVYREDHDEDGFLYMMYASQEMFGFCT